MEVGDPDFPWQVDPANAAAVERANEAMERECWDEALEALSGAKEGDGVVWWTALKCAEEKHDDPAANACIDRLFELSRGDAEAFAFASYRRGLLLAGKGRHAEALAYLRDAERSCKDCTRYVALLSCLGGCFMRLGAAAHDEKRFSEAVEYLTQAEKCNDGNADFSCAVMQQLAESLTALGDFKRALECNKKVVETAEAAFGKEHEKYGSSLIFWGGSLYFLRRYAAALEMFTNARRICLAFFGEGHVRCADATALVNYADIALRYGRTARGDEQTTTGQCESCERVGEGLGCCGGCRRVWYCNQECQNSHWPAHKADCRKWNCIVVEFAVPIEGRGGGLLSKREIMLEYLQHRGAIKTPMMELSSDLRQCLASLEFVKVVADAVFVKDDFTRAEMWYTDGIEAWTEYCSNHALEVGTPFLVVEFFNGLAGCRRELRDWTGAVELYSRVLELRQDHPDARALRACALENLGQIREALCDFRLVYDGNVLEERPDPLLDAIRALWLWSEEEESRCGNCAQPGVSQCGGCHRVRYCSRACQKKHWPAHRLKCGETSVRMAGADGSWCRGVNKSLVVRRLQESYRLRRSDVWKWKEETIGSFDDFLNRASDKCLLPRWWSAFEAKLCLEQTRELVGLPLVKRDVAAEEVSLLRSLSATVYGTSYCSPVMGAPL
jgi:tetratricopeptide (TPR) repeat protein